MQSPDAVKLQIGSWSVDSAVNQISRNGETLRVDTRTMRLLQCLAEHPGQIVSIDHLLSEVWPEVTVSSDSVYHAVASLRRTLGDDPKNPTYIETVPRLGYRMIAAVTPSTSQSPDKITTTPTRPRKFLLGWVVATALCLTLIAAFVLRHRFGDINQSAARHSSQSIGVLPLLDLTDAMNEEPFADGMTEELIDKLTKIPNLHVPPPASSFYFKGKQIPIADIAKSLGVAYILDGSVRKSGTMLRVAARLTRADNGFIVWSETYDRPFLDKLEVQDEIAIDVTKALRASIEEKAAGSQ